ncbi:hypothetical protein LTR17_003215 [Elasticomyces elasticus]|nr:hypothetical protein LTR17_003215 [Elasticomyces elasticus]
MHFSVAFVAFVATTWALVPAPLEQRKADKGDEIVKLARQQIGKPYVWGGGNCKGATKEGQSKAGFDCSGLNKYVVCQVSDKKYDLPNHAQTQYNDYKKWGGKHIAIKDAQPGDMFYYSHNSSRSLLTIRVQQVAEILPDDCKHDVTHTNIKASKDTVINAPAPGRNIAEKDSSWYLDNSELRVCPYAIRFWD